MLGYVGLGYVRFAFVKLGQVMLGCANFRRNNLQFLKEEF
jgi:hypothetical protein